MANSAIKRDHSSTPHRGKGKYQSLVKWVQEIVIAIGHKMMGVIYSVMNNDRPYTDQKLTTAYGGEKCSSMGRC